MQSCGTIWQPGFVIYWLRKSGQYYGKLYIGGQMVADVMCQEFETMLQNLTYKMRNYS